MLNAGATPRMGRFDQLSWADFTATWETDVKAGLYWLQAALNLPLKPGSRVLVGSSGAAAERIAALGRLRRRQAHALVHGQVRQRRRRSRRGSGIRFQAIVPQQMIGGTGVGDAGASAYARAMGIEPEAFLARFGAPMPPREFGDHVVAVLDDPQYADGLGLRPEGRYGITVLEGEAA